MYLWISSVRFEPSRIFSKCTYIKRSHYIDQRTGMDHHSKQQWDLCRCFAQMSNKLYSKNWTVLNTSSLTKISSFNQCWISYVSASHNTSLLSLIFVVNTEWNLIASLYAMASNINLDCKSFGRTGRVLTTVSMYYHE